MTNKLIKKKYNKYLAPRNNYYAFGDFLFNKNKDGKVTDTERSFGNLNEGASAAMSTAGTLAGGLIGGGLQSGAGNVINGLSNIAAAIPGPWGAVASAGLNVLGGITNSLFGSKLNQENIAKVENNINSLNSFQTNASDFDSLSQQWNSAPVGMTFNNKFIGKDGLFSNKAEDKANSLRAQIKKGENWVQSSLENNAENITTNQLHNLLANYNAFGGHLMTHGADFNNGLIVVDNGGTHEESPYDGVPMGVDPEGVPNLVEEGEVIFNDYVFSNRLKVPKMVKKKYKLGSSKSLTFADAALKMSKESEERPNDSISQRGLEDSMIKLIMAQEEVRSKKSPQLNGNRFDDGGDKETARIRPVVKPIHTSIDPYGVTPNDIYTYGLAPTPISKPPVDAIIDNTVPYSRTTPKNLLPTWSRYLPAYASGIMSLTDALGWTNKPDYSEADAILEASKEAGTYNPIKFSPIGNYLKYEPFDVDRAINKMSAQAGATRRNIMNTSGGNSARTTAGLLAADYNSLNAIGDLAVKARESNLDQKYKVEDYNRATDMYNHTGAFNADKANQEALLSAKNSYLKGALTAAEVRQKERQLSTAARSANLSNFINSWGDIGRENFTMNMINDNQALYYYLTNQGGSNYKGTSQRAEGGLLTIKKRKRRK